jgi:hypothetical protein
MSTQRGPEIIELSRQIDALALRRSEAIAAFEAARGYDAYGCPNTVAFLKVHCRLSASAAMEVLSVARRLPQLPEVQEAVAQGEIGFQHAAVIAESVERVGASSLLEHQSELVARAQESDPSSLRQDVKKVELEVDSRRMKQEAEWAYESRGLDLRTLKDGRLRVEGLLDSEGGALVKTALDAALGARGKGDRRSDRQRRADGWVDVARRALEGRGLPQTGCQRPHLNLTVQLETLAQIRDQPGSLAGVGPQLPETIERHLCDASLSITVEHEGEVLLAGKEKRTFSGSARRALALRSRHCQWPGGCDRPAAWCEGHHLVPWLQRRRTRPEEGALLCAYHHRLVHEGGWRLELERGDLVATGPGGRQRYRSAKAPPAA